MNLRPLIQKSIPHIAVVVFFYLLTLVIFRPMIFEDKDFYQHDIFQSIGKNHNLSQYHEKYGEQALWNNAMFSGAPEAFDRRFTENIFHFITRVMTLGFSSAPAKVFYCLLGAYMMLLAFRIRPLFAMMGALVFALCGFNIIGLVAGHNARIQAIAFFPIIIGGVHYAFCQHRSIGAMMVMLGLGLQIRSNHLQITYYTLLATLILGLVFFIYAAKENALKDFFKTVGLLAIAAIISVGANSGKLWSVYEYGQYSIRGKNELASTDQKGSGLDKDYAFHYSNGIFEPLVLFIPHILGGASSEPLDGKSNVADALRKAGYNRAQINQQIQQVPTYWGNQPLTAPYYLSVVVVFLFVLSFYYLSKKEKIWIYTIIGLGIVLSWGSNFSSFNHLLFDYLPGYNKFRSVTFTLLLPVTGLILSGFLALERFALDGSKKKTRHLFIAGAVTAGFALFLIVISGTLSYSGKVDGQLPEWYLEALKKDRKSLLIKDAFKAISIVLMVVGILFAIQKKKISHKIGYAMLALLVFLEMYSKTSQHIDESKFSKNTMAMTLTPTDADQVILNEVKVGGRVLNLQNPFNESATSYFHESIGGYHGAKLGRYQDLIEYHLHGEIQNVVGSLKSQSLDFSENNALNMLNTQFIKYGDQRNNVVKNDYAAGHVWSVNDLIRVASANDEMEKIKDIDIRNEAIVDDSFKLTDSNYTKGEIQVVSRNNNKIVYESRSEDTMFAVFSEIYYPKGWRVTIDDETADMVRVNYLLRGLEIPAGSHTIVFSFEPESYFIGRKVALVFSFFVVLFIGGIVFFEWRKSNSLNKKDV